MVPGDVVTGVETVEVALEFRHFGGAVTGQWPLQLVGLAACALVPQAGLEIGRLREKRARRAADELQRPLADYRAAEMAELERNFYGFDPSYHIARHHFVYKTPHSWTPRHLAIHRELGWQPAP